MILQEGKRYRDRKGRETEPLVRDEEGFTQVGMFDGWFPGWNEDGSATFFSTPEWNREYDLVEELP